MKNMIVSDERTDRLKVNPIFIKGSKTGILMLHGLTATPDDLANYAEKFSSYNYTVSAPLLRGHGTRVDDLQQTYWNDWFADTKKAFIHLQSMCNNIFVVGQSVGGTLALHLAAHCNVDALVLLAPGLFFKNKATILLPVLSHLKKYLPKKNGPDIKNNYSRKKALSYMKIPTQSIIQASHMFKHVKQELADVNCPTLIFHSVNDHVIDYKSSEVIYNQISSTQKQLITLHHSYHVLSMDNEKNIIFHKILEFIKPLLS